MAALVASGAQQAAALETASITSAGSAGLGGLCLSRDVMPDGLVCNPAYLPELTESALLGRVAIGNGYPSLVAAKGLLFDRLSKSFLQNLFREHSSTRLGLDTELAFLSPYAAASFMPYRIRYASDVHNPNFPVIAVQAFMEQSLGLAGGTSLGFIAPILVRARVGARLRLVQRRIVQDAFSMVSIMTQDPHALLQPRTELSLEGDAVVAWVDTVLGWQVRVSGGILQMGSHLSAGTPTLPTEWVPRIGVGLTPPLPMGELRLGIDVQGKRALRLFAGASYRLGMLEASLGGSAQGLACGLAFTLGTFHFGVAYERPQNPWDDTYGNTITTEVALRL